MHMLLSFLVFSYSLGTKLQTKTHSKTSSKLIVSTKGESDADNESKGFSQEDPDNENDVVENQEDVDSFISLENDIVNSVSGEDNESDLVENNKNSSINTDNYNKENNNNVMNFVELDNPKGGSAGKNPLKVPPKTNTNYAYSLEAKEKTEIAKARDIAHQNLVASTLLKRKVNTSIAERIEGSFRKYRLKNGGEGDAFTSFLSYLKDASDRATIKMKILKKIHEGGFKAEKKPRQ